MKLEKEIYKLYTEYENWVDKKNQPIYKRNRARKNGGCERPYEVSFAGFMDYLKYISQHKKQEESLK